LKAPLKIGEQKMQPERTVFRLPSSVFRPEALFAFQVLFGLFLGFFFLQGLGRLFFRIFLRIHVFAHEFLPSCNRRDLTVTPCSEAGLERRIGRFNGPPSPEATVHTAPVFSAFPSISFGMLKSSEQLKGNGEKWNNFIFT
jgi:hypothetical protein